MRYTYFKLLSASLAVLSVFTGSLAQATCLRCQKIEEERARQQALHPEQPQYYDEAIISLNTEKPTLSNSSKDYSTIATILQSKDFLTTLGGPFTLFIPSNEALFAYSPGRLHELSRPENSDQLATFVSHYVVPSKILKPQVQEKNVVVKALSGKNLNIHLENGVLFVNEARVLRSEPAGQNGVIYIIDRVL